jgi:hypothetical protein
VPEFPIVSSDFNQYGKELPEWISKMVKEDNAAHNADRQMFNPVFFGFIRILLKYLTSEILDLEDDAPSDEIATIYRPIQSCILEIGQKVAFDMLTHFEKDEVSNSICSSVRSVFSFSDPIKQFAK